MKYIVIALSVGGLNKVFNSGEIVEDGNFPPDHASKLVEQGFIKPVSDSELDQEVAAREQSEKERLAAEQVELERKEAEETAKRELEARAKEDEEKLLKQMEEEERAAKAEKERLAAEQAGKESDPNSTNRKK